MKTLQDSQLQYLSPWSFLKDQGLYHVATVFTWVTGLVWTAFCDNYGEAGALNYYGPKYQLPKAYSDNASFLYWMPPDFDQFEVLLLVTDDKQGKHSGIKSNEVN